MASIIPTNDIIERVLNLMDGGHEPEDSPVSIDHESQAFVRYDAIRLSSPEDKRGSLYVEYIRDGIVMAHMDSEQTGLMVPTASSVTIEGLRGYIPLQITHGATYQPNGPEPLKIQSPVRDRPKHIIVPSGRKVNVRRAK